MADFFEIDFLDVETDKSGDAIALRYELNGRQSIHVVDGGYAETGPALVEHLRNYYGAPKHIDHVVVTHCDRDHTGGICAVLEAFSVGTLWMLRPWDYADELLPKFPTYASVERLRARLRSIYSNLVAVEELAVRRRIPIASPFQGAKIGMFTVLSPSKPRFLDLILESDKTPESVEAAAATLSDKAWWVTKAAAKRIATFVKALWGEETFSADGTSAENEMSVVQCATLCGQKIVLTGDAGRTGLADAAEFAPSVGFALPGVNRIQVPHHGSRRNVSSEVLDRWLGPRLPAMPSPGSETFTAIVSSAKKDQDHPRKAVVRAFMHRGAKFIATESRTVRSSGGQAPPRSGWQAVTAVEYPDAQEE